MAARYVDPGNVVAQGQSFYTGLLPGSYEKGAGGGGGSNVYGKGSGGSAGVSADRTSSEAGVKSIKDYKPGGSIFIPQRSDSDRLDQIAKNTAPGGPGGGQVVGQGVAALLGGGSANPQGPNPFGQNPMGSKASTRSHTRQPGVQQSATQQSIPFPNLANSTDRSLNF